MLASRHGGLCHRIEQRVLYRPSPACPRSPHVCRVSPTGEDREGFGQRTLVTTTVPGTTPRQSALILRSSLCSRLVIFA